ncbi:MAG: hypothetical protein ABR957_09940 [Terracidiphilus sp.]|jgi:hypothetical protein
MNRRFSTPSTKTSRRGPRIWIPLGCTALAILVCVPWVVRASGAEGGFDGVVDSIEHQYHVRATRIPLMGLASLLAGTATHGGVGRVQIAEFEHFTKPADGEELNRMVQEKLGEGWSRIIRETSREGNEQTLIFARGEGNRMGLFILDLDGNEMDIVQVSVDPDHLNDTIKKYDHHDEDGHESN